MIRTKRKINKQRGSRSNGGGCTKKRRGAGNKGGKGKAGMGKQHWTWTVIHDPDHSGFNTVQPVNEADELSSVQFPGLQHLQAENPDIPV